MAIRYHPKTGTILICDFRGFEEPEMVKRRPVVVVSPRFRERNGLCTVVPLSLTEPNPKMPYHYHLNIKEPLPPPYDSSALSWVKGDMLATVSFNRLSFPYNGKDACGKRINVFRVIGDSDLKKIRECILSALALWGLTKHF